MKSKINTIARIAAIAAFGISMFSSRSENPKAFLKAQYDQIHTLHGKKAEDSYRSVDKFILLIADGTSQYYDPQTFYIDSLEHDPTGRAALDLMWKDAYDQMMTNKADPFKIMRDKGFTRGERLRVNKDFREEKLIIRNSNGADRHRYEVDMSDLVWELSDSTKNVMGYDCQMAEGDYHGRRWRAWFAPEISVQEGPWQLCGLPGLIMEAETLDGDYEFHITGLQKCDEDFKPVYDEQKYFTTKRKSFWKMKDYSRRNRATQISAMTGGAVKISENANYKGTDDFIETDYHD